MKLLFVDESSDNKFARHLSVCLATIDAAHYRTLKDGFHSILRENHWNEDIEFKGAHLFSASRGDTAVPVERRISIVDNLIGLCSGRDNARSQFFVFSHPDADSHRETYLRALPGLIRRGLPRASRGRGKDLVSLSCDYRSDVNVKDIHQQVIPALSARGYQLCEAVSTPASSFHTVGILLADIVSYLAARVETISNDSELFEGLTETDRQSNAKVRKLTTSNELLGKLKRFRWWVPKAI